MLDEQIDNWIRTLGSHDANVREEAVRALEQIGSPAVPQLSAALDGLHIRSDAARLLGVLADRRAVAPLIALLETAPLGVCAVVAEALGRLGDERAIAPLIQAALCWNAPEGRPFDPDGSVGRLCKRTTAALIKLGASADCFLFVRAILDQRNGDEAREAVAEEIATLDDVTALPLLLDMMALHDATIRLGAARALLHMGGAEGLPRRVLAEGRLTAPQRVRILERLRQGRFPFPGGELRYPMPDLVPFCEQMQSSEDATLRQGARDTLGYYTLARPSQREPDREEEELLRPAHGAGVVEAKTLLRATESSLPSAPTGAGFSAVLALAAAPVPSPMTRAGVANATCATPTPPGR